MSGRHRFVAPEKAKKALNAFVGFRCYYISIPHFKSWPMKKLSNLIGLLWETDPNKSLWSLMTKAWSAIRDQIGKDRAPLDQFFYSSALTSTCLRQSHTLRFLDGLSQLTKRAIPRSPMMALPGLPASVLDFRTLRYLFKTLLPMFSQWDTHLPMSLMSTPHHQLSSDIRSPLTAEKSNLARAATPAVAPATDRRITAPASAASLEQDILNAHRVDPGRAGEYMPDHYPTPAAVNYDPIPFYDQLVGYFDSPIPNFQDDAAMSSGATLIDATPVSDDTLHGEMDDIVSNAAFFQSDFDAFRPAPTGMQPFHLRRCFQRLTSPSPELCLHKLSIQDAHHSINDSSFLRD
ncbi:unnamed protein product [Alternaria alternata]